MFHSSLNPVPCFDQDSDIEFHPAFRPDDIRSFAEVVSFWDKSERRNPPQVPSYQTYCPARLNRDTNLHSYMVAESFCGEPSVHQVDVAVSRLRFRRVYPSQQHPLKKLVKWYCRKFGNANQYYDKFKSVISRFNIEKFLKRNKGKPYTKRNLHRMAICKAWLQLAPSYVPIEIDYEPQAGGFVYNQLFKNVRYYSDMRARNANVYTTSVRYTKPVNNKCAACKSDKGDDCPCVIDMNVEYVAPSEQNYTRLPFAYISQLLVRLKNRIIDLVNLRTNSDISHISSTTIRRHPRSPYVDCVEEIVPELVPIEPALEALDYFVNDEVSDCEEVIDYSDAWDEYLNGRPCMYYNVHEPGLPGGMENASEHGAEGLTMQQASNVIISTENEVTKAGPEYNAIRWDKYVTSDKIVAVDDMTDRWFTIKQGSWTTDQATGSELFYLALPEDALTQMADQVPNVPFLCHTQFNCDMEIKLLINSNAFQVGMLQMSWIYMDQVEGQVTENVRSNVYTLSQTHHVCVSANAQNEASLYIPYLYPFPMMYVKPPGEYESKRIMGTLRVKVLNKLNVAVGGPMKAYYSVVIRFPKCTFSGMRKATLSSQMLPLTTIVGQIALRRLERELESNSVNADNPYNPLPPPYIVPRSAHNLSYGKNAEDQLMSMRLDASSASPHACMPEMNELRVEYLCSVFGLLKILEWKVDDPVGKSFFAKGLPVEPFVGLNVESWDVDATSLVGKKYALPPVAVVSSMFNQWRGCLDFKIDIISSQYHTGKLLVAYVPSLDTGKELKLEECYSSPHIVVDINAQNSITFRIPYISSTVWQRRAYTGNATGLSLNAVSRLYMFVYNPCINAAAASDTIYVNVYVRGAPDFEVSIPAQPSVGLSYNTAFFPIASVYTPIKGDPYYAGTWVNFVSERCVFRYEYISITEPGVSEWPAPPERKSGYSYYLAVEDKKYAPLWVSNEQTPSWDNTIPIEYGVLCDVSVPKKGMWYVIPVKYASWAALLDNAIYNDKKDLKTLASYMLNATNISEKDVPYSKPGCRWVIKAVKNDSLVMNVQNERDECRNVMQLGTNLASTGHGRKMYGESFGDLKDLLRRYQLYGSIDVDVSYLKNVYECRIRIPVAPQGLDLVVSQDKVVHSTFNRCREGPIPLVLSGFRFFDGGINIKIVFPEISETVVWVQHRPDNPSHDRTIRLCNNVNSGRDILNHGFATEIQVCKINPIVELHIPYYLFSTFGLLQKVDSKSANVYKFICGLGTINIGFNTNANVLPKIKNVHISVFYSLADDFQPLLFYGFPPLLVLDKLPEKLETVVTEDFVEIPPIPSVVSPTINIQNDFSKPKQCPPDIEPQGLGDFFKNKLKKFTKEAAEEELPLAVNTFQDILNEAIAKVNGSADPNHNSDKYAVVVNILSQLLHCMVSPTPHTIAIAVVTSLFNLGVLVFKHIQRWISIFIEVFTTYFPSIGTPQDAVQPPDIRVQNDRELEEKRINNIASWVTLIFTSIAALCDYKSKKKPDNWAQLIKNFTSSIGESTKQGNWVHTFIKKTFVTVEYIWHWIMRKTVNEYAWCQALGYCDAEIAEWMRECTIVTDKYVYDNRLCDPNYHERVYAVKQVGEGLIASMSPEMIQHKNVAPFLKMYDAVTTIYNQLIAAGKSPGVRKLNFTLYVFGPPGIGKSCMSNVIARDLLKSIEYKSPFDLAYVHNPQSMFWDDCRHQPVMIIDDMWHDRSPTTVSNQLLTLFQVCSPVPLIPPKASLEDKGMRYNPEILIMNSNFNYVYLPNVCDDAVNRRRDVLLSAELIPLEDIKTPKIGCEHCKTGRISDADPIQLEDMHHLRFKWCFDKLKHSPTKESAWMNYEEMMKMLKPVFAKQRVNAAKLFMRDLLINNELRCKNPSDKSAHLKNILDVFDAKSDDLCLEERMNLIKQNLLRNQQYNRNNLLGLLNKLKVPDRVRNGWIESFNRYSQIKLYYNKILYSICSKLKSDRFFTERTADSPPDCSRKFEKESEEMLEMEVVNDSEEDVFIAPVVVRSSSPDVEIVTAKDLPHFVELVNIDLDAASVSFSNGAHELDVQNDPQNVIIDDGEDIPTPPPNHEPRGVAKTEKEYLTHDSLMKEFRSHPVTAKMEVKERRIPTLMQHLVHQRAKVVAEEARIKKEVPCPNYVPENFVPPREDDCIPESDDDDIEEVVFESPPESSEMYCAFGAVINRFVQKGYISGSIGKSMYNGGEYEQPGASKSEAAAVILVLERVFDGMSSTFKNTRSIMRSLQKYCIENPQASFCKHMRDDMRKYMCFDRNIMMPDGTANAMLTCGVNCPLTIKSLYKAWMLEWLHAHPSMLLLLRQKKYACLPHYFAGYDDHASIVNNLYQWLRACWLDRVKPAAIKLCQAIARHFLMILYCALMAASIVSVLACAVIDLRCAQVASQKAAAYKRQNNPPPPPKVAARTPGSQQFNNVEAESKIYNHDTPKTVKKSDQKTFNPQGITQQAEVVCDRVRMNSVWLMVYYRNKWHEMRCLGLKNHSMYILRHYLDNIASWYERSREKGLEFRITLKYEYNHNFRCTNADGFPLQYDSLILNCPPCVDTVHSSHLILVELPRSVPPFKDITKFIARVSDHQYVSGECYFIIGANRVVQSKFKYVNLEDYKEGICVSGKEGEDRVEPVRLEQAYMYPVQQNGYCGSVLIDTSLQRPIIGIHVCGSEQFNIGFSEILFSEDVASVKVDEFNDVDRVYPEWEEMNSEMFAAYEGVINPQGYVSESMRHVQARKTAICKSKVHGVFPVETEPNPLHARDPRLPLPLDPLLEGVKHHGEVVKDFPQDLLYRAYESVSAHVCSNVKPILLRENLTMQEAICGVPNVNEFDSLSWNTSAGYPLQWKKPAGAKGKRWLFNLEESESGYVCIGIDKRLSEQMDMEMSMRKKNVVPCTVFVDCLKDTCLPLEKCRINGKTRIFSISPVQYTIPFRMKLGNFMGSYRRARFAAGHAIGVNVNSHEWGMLANLLRQKGTKVCIGDYKNFGPGLNEEVAKYACKIVCDWYDCYFENSSDKIVRKVLMNELLNAYHLCERTVYKVVAGVPSGSPITDILNSLVNWIYVSMAWLDICKQPFDVFLKEVYMCVYGDDVIFSVSDEYSDKFNSVSLNEWFAKYNVVFTDTDKLSGKIVKFRDLSSANFLKRHFVVHPLRVGEYLAPLDVVSINSACNWIHKSLPPETATIENCLQSMELAYGCGPDEYKRRFRKLVVACMEVNLSFACPTWYEVDARVFDEC